MIELAVGLAGLAVGRIVHYTDQQGEVVAGLIVKVWDHAHGVVNLQVFTTGEYAVGGTRPEPYIVTGILPSDPLHEGALMAASSQTNRWHWPPKVG